MPENDDYHWLTYESLFNKGKFKKPKCRFKLGLYLIPLNDLIIWLRDDLSENHLQAFIDAFFPDLYKDTLKELANGFWSWKHEDSDLVGEMQGNTFLCSPRKSQGGRRNRVIIYIEPYAVLPYNRYDNTAASNAIATKNSGKLLRVKNAEPYFWDAWKTASRSCVVKLPNEPVKKKGVNWLPIKSDSIAQKWTDWTFSDEHRVGAFDTLADAPYDLKTRGERDFSLKTGVEFVGQNNQGGYNHKDVIGDWLIGCLRSDYIMMVDKKLKPPKEGLIILTELITVTEKVTRTHTGNSSVKYKEGIQVRDLSVLDKNKIYIAPLNIPFIGPDVNDKFDTLKEEFHYLKDTVGDDERAKWCDFWKFAFATALGRTKALLLLRYGLQIMNPNQQNYLIEFDKKGNNLVPTGNVVIRDLNDASVVREIVWALFDGPGLPPQKREEGSRLAELDVPTFKFEYEEGRMAKEGFDNQDNQETGSTPTAFGPPGIQFLWQRFTSFGTGFKFTKIKDEKPLFDVWKNLLWAMSDWGIAHSKAFINTIEIHIGKNFRAIDWKKYPEPARYKNLATIEQSEAQAIKYTPVTASDDPNFKITSQINFNFPGTKVVWESKFDPQTPFRDDLKGKPCLIISGNGFQKTTTVKFGDTPIKPEDVFWASAEKIYVHTTDELKPLILLVTNKKTEITLTNAGKPSKTATYKPVPDADQPGELGWEEIAAKVIHDYLKDAEGQAAIKKCRDEGWKLVKPTTILQFKGSDGKPFAWKRVFMKSATGEWTDLTNRKGEIYVYKEATDVQVQFCPQKDETMKNATVWLDSSGIWEGITIKVS